MTQTHPNFLNLKTETFSHLTLDWNGPVLTLCLNRPQQKNAMNRVLVDELSQVFDLLIQGFAQDPNACRIVVLKGSEANFCAGADIKELSQIKQMHVSAEIQGTLDDPAVDLNRAFGTMIQKANALHQTLIVQLEGAVLGGGFGLACVSDIALAHQDAVFGLPETGLGVIPAQIAPFVVKRIGLTQSRYLALTGSRFKAEQALNWGLIHGVFENDASLAEAIEQHIVKVLNCAPQANATTKALMLEIEHFAELNPLLDQAATAFAHAVRNTEGQEGTKAFIEKRKPFWQSTKISE
jgi:isohexenylglutaconyl-CoA hydratase